MPFPAVFFHRGWGGGLVFADLWAYSLYSDWVLLSSLALMPPPPFFLFCNQLSPNTAVQVFRLFQLGGCATIRLIVPLCSMFWMSPDEGGAGLICVESFSGV